MDKKSLTGTDIRTKYITPAIAAACSDVITQVPNNGALWSRRTN